MKLIVVPTPIGNLEDASFRSIECLKSADFILAEDTRHTAILLKHYSISTPMRAFHMHNEHRVVDAVLAQIKHGQTAALVSDAGMPGISDPGYLLVRACVEEHIPVECLPGPSAFLPALIASGLPADKFCFEGFLPAKKGRRKRLETLASEMRTLVFYEAPHRLVRTLTDLAEHFGNDRAACVSREISKKFEQHHRGSLGELIDEFHADAPRGEIVLVLGPPARAKKQRTERGEADSC